MKNKMILMDQNCEELAHNLKVKAYHLKGKTKRQRELDDDE